MPYHVSIRHEASQAKHALAHHSSAHQASPSLQSVGGNSAKSGLKPGDTVIYTSSWFGDELWPADNPAFVNTALARAPSPVFIEYVKGDNKDIKVRHACSALGTGPLHGVAGLVAPQALRAEC